MEGETEEARDNSEKICAQDIPDDIVFDILTRLPVKSVLRFKCVCKSWLSMISHPKFIKTHLHLSTERLLLSTNRFPVSFASIDFEFPHQDSEPLHRPWGNSWDSYFRALCSCDGLILLSVHGGAVDRTKPGTSFVLWNPSNRSHRRISCPYVLPCISFHGLCYDSTDDDFRVFIVFRKKKKETLVAVYSLRNNSWNMFIDNRYFLRLLEEQQAVVNGAVHWVMYSTVSSLGVIVYFDLAEGKFKEVLPPSSRNEYDRMNLMVLGGFLCVYYCNERDKQIEVYVMKEYAKQESWIRLFVMPWATIEGRFRYVTLLRLTKKGQVLISAGERRIGTAGEKGIGIYDPRDGTFLLYDYIRGQMPIPYVESLVSLNGEV